MNRKHVFSIAVHPDGQKNSAKVDGADEGSGVGAGLAVGAGLGSGTDADRKSLTRAPRKPVSALCAASLPSPTPAQLAYVGAGEGGTTEGAAVGAGEGGTTAMLQRMP